MQAAMQTGAWIGPFDIFFFTRALHPAHPQRVPLKARWICHLFGNPTQSGVCNPPKYESAQFFRVPLTSSLGARLCRRTKSMRRACFVIRSKAVATAAGGAVHTGNTISMPSKHPSSVSGRVRSPRTTSTCGGNRAAPGSRAIARTCMPVAANRDNLAADGTSRSNNEYRIHAEPS